MTPKAVALEQEAKSASRRVNAAATRHLNKAERDTLAELTLRVIETLKDYNKMKFGD